MIKIKTPSEIESMKPAGALSKMALRRVGAQIRPGVSTLELDRVAEGIIRMHGAVPAFKGYGGFPASICCSINEEIVHGIPSADIRLKDGDIVSIDTGAVLNGWVGDNAWTFYCGTPSREDKELCEVTRDCLKLAIKQAIPGNHLGDIGHAVQEHAEAAGFNVVREFGGHGIGCEFHEDPFVGFVGEAGEGTVLAPGFCFTIEPMVNAGEPGIDMSDANGWTVRTADGSDSAQWEVQLVITNDGYERISW